MPPVWLRYYLPPLVWSALIFAGSASSSLGSLPVFLPQGIDKLVHACEFAVLAVLTARALRQAVSGPLRTCLLGGCAIAAVFGVSDELHQLFVAGRSADIADWIADVTGACLGCLAYQRFLRHRNR